MALSAVAEEYFRTMNPLAAKIHEDIAEAKNAYENIWESLTEKEKVEIINESIIKPEKHSNDLMSFFGREHGQRTIQDEHTSYKDEYSAPFIYQTKSQLNLCALSEFRTKEAPISPPPSYKEDQEVTSPGFISKFISNFKSKDEDKECLVSVAQTQIVASSDNFFRTNFKSPERDRYDYRSSIAKSNSDLSEENRGLLSSHASSGTDFQSTETLTESTTLPKTGYDFLDNW
ncbi:hypothetical protein ACJJTC_011029 [Scirpophaga incertulas]